MPVKENVTWKYAPLVRLYKLLVSGYLKSTEMGAVTPMLPVLTTGLSGELVSWIVIVAEPCLVATVAPPPELLKLTTGSVGTSCSVPRAIAGQAQNTTAEINVAAPHAVLMRRPPSQSSLRSGIFGKMRSEERRVGKE